MPHCLSATIERVAELPRCATRWMMQHSTFLSRKNIHPTMHDWILHPESVPLPEAPFPRETQRLPRGAAKAIQLVLAAGGDTPSLEQAVPTACAAIPHPTRWVPPPPPAIAAKPCVLTPALEAVTQPHITRDEVLRPLMPPRLPAESVVSTAAIPDTMTPSADTATTLPGKRKPEGVLEPYPAKAPRREDEDVFVTVHKTTEALDDFLASL